jgi:pimeloyl-ACP methyl ester carboxylesterase
MATFVLVHGAFHGGWIWQRVAARLRQAGHLVHTPTLTGCGEKRHLLAPWVSLETHIQDIVGCLEYEDVREGILVGHSYAGVPTIAAAARAPERVARLVHFDSLAPRAGETASGPASSQLAEQVAALARGEPGWLLDPTPIPAVELSTPADVAWVEPRRHPHPLRTLLEPIPGDEPAAPRSYIVCTRRELLAGHFGTDPLAAPTERAAREGWDIHRIDAGHDAHVTHPAEVAQALVAHVA